MCLELRLIVDLVLAVHNISQSEKVISIKFVNNKKFLYTHCRAHCSVEMIIASSICLNNMLDVLLIKFNGFMELHKPEFIHKPNTFMQYLIYVLTMTERAGMQPLSPGTSFRSVVTR